MRLLVSSSTMFRHEFRQVFTKPPGPRDKCVGCGTAMAGTARVPFYNERGRVWLCSVCYKVFAK